MQECDKRGRFRKYRCTAFRLTNIDNEEFGRDLVSKIIVVPIVAIKLDSRQIDCSRGA